MKATGGPYPRSEGVIPYAGFETFYRTVGNTDPGKLPVLCLAGGPGSPHDYLEPLEDLAEGGRQVVFYDAIGCGRSSRPKDPDLWTIDLFVKEVMAIRVALGLGEIHLVGHSWGGMLAMEYLLTEDESVKSVVLASTLTSTSLFVSEVARLRRGLPADVREVLDEHEAAGTTDDPAYQQAVFEFYRVHSCRVDPWPDCLNRSFNEFGYGVYNTMWGPNDMLATGTLLDWDITDRLGELRPLPTLVTSGRYDECTPVTVQAVHDAIPGSQWVVFENSSHLAFIEEADAFIGTLESFFSDVESARSS